MTDLTIAHVDRDFIEWHGGIERYAAWMILIEDPSWLDWCREARRQVADLVLPGYERQPHVTVLAAGLVASNHLSRKIANAQASAVRRADSATANLRAVGLGASHSCPFIEVHDDAWVVPRLRGRLADVHPEDALQNSNLDHPDDSFDFVHERNRPADVTPPHITLGLFSRTESLEAVRSRLASVPQPDLPPLRLDTLHLCSYDTRSVQGPPRIQREVTW